ncbi:hypothetical protein C8R44DRAFT_747374 [Mycena epipterygia]|nr:hypothetical protein C8R44DRAFT_747374 [Mycena epipterygia]
MIKKEGTRIGSNAYIGNNKGSTRPHGWDRARTSGGNGEVGREEESGTTREGGRGCVRGEDTNGRESGKSKGGYAEWKERSTCGVEEWDERMPVPRRECGVRSPASGGSEAEQEGMIDAWK